MFWKHLQRTWLGGAGLLLCSVAALASPSSTVVRWSTLEWAGPQASARLESGERVPLGLDPELQQNVSILLKWAKPVAGAAALVDVATGQVLAAHEVGSSPRSLLFEPVAPAASVFKLVTTAALFERTEVTPRTSVCTKGGLRDITREHLRPAAGPDALCAPFAHALGVSRNAAFAQLATTRLLHQDLVDVAATFGFNAALPLDVPGMTGTLSVPYNDLEFARTAAGFDNSSLSVFGGAHLAMIVATGGLERRMHLTQSTDQPSPARRVISARTARRLRKAMEVTIHSGTAREAFVDARGKSTLGPIQAAGKTGTLSPGRGQPTASWFIGFAPSDHPKVVVSVVLMNPVRWHRKGHQLARDLLGAYFQKKGVMGLELPL